MTVAALALLSLQKLSCMNLLQGIREDSHNVYPITPRCQFRIQTAIIPAEDKLLQGKTIVNWVHTKLQAFDLFFSRVIHVPVKLQTWFIWNENSSLFLIHSLVGGCLLLVFCSTVLYYCRRKGSKEIQQYTGGEYNPGFVSVLPPEKTKSWHFSSHERRLIQAGIDPRDFNVWV